MGILKKILSLSYTPLFTEQSIDAGVILAPANFPKLPLFVVEVKRPFANSYQLDNRVSPDIKQLTKKVLRRDTIILKGGFNELLNKTQCGAPVV